MFEAGIQLYNYMETFFCCTVNQKEEFDPAGMAYRKVGEKVGNPFQDGNQLK